MKVEDVLPKQEPIRAWAGDQDDLFRLAEVVDEQFKLERGFALADLKRDLRDSAAKNIIGRETKRSRELSEQRIRQAEDSWQVTLEVRDRGGRARKGDCKSLLAEVNSNSLAGLTLSCSKKAKLRRNLVERWPSDFIAASKWGPRMGTGCT